MTQIGALPAELSSPRGQDWPGLSGVTLWRTWAAAQTRWGLEHGWTRRQVLGLRHPDWIAAGWADEPPEGTRDPR